MTRNRLLSFSIVVLLLSNLLLAVFIIIPKDRHRPNEGPRNIIIENLDFDEYQITAYDKLIEAHQKDIRGAEQEISSLKNNLYNGLNDDSAQNNKDSIIAQICKVQMKIENIHYAHFQDIKKLCKPNQIESYKQLTTKIAELFARQQMKPKRK